MFTVYYKGYYINCYIDKSECSIAGLSVPKFKTLNGAKRFITKYKFACGDIEQKEIDENNRGTIALEPNGYHVKGFSNSVHFWEIFAKISDARKYLNRMIKTA